MSRLGFFVDQVFSRDDAGWSSDEAYTLFPMSLAGDGDEIVLIGRGAPLPGSASFRVDGPNVDVVPLPHYDNVRDLWRNLRTIRSGVRDALTPVLPTLDAMLISGPNPIGQFVAELCAEAGVPVVPIVRQNLVKQVWFANEGPTRWLGASYASVLEAQFRQLARGNVVLAVGQEMTDAYGKVSDRVHNHFASLIDDELYEKLIHQERPDRPSDDRQRLLFVGRVSREKGLANLLDALALLRQRGMTPQVELVGDGPALAELQAQSTELGLDDQVTFHGFVSFGPELLDFYARSDALVVPSLPGEGFPQVINEALASGLPVIATTVAGIPAFLTDGDTALLVEPGDVDGLAGAIERLLSEPDLRETIVDRGRHLMAAHTVERTRDRLLGVLRAEVLT